ncbi:MAG: replication protein RepA [Candidatus Cloacimonas sp.]|jgi:hypothetical protein|nr:replication protein RepA [Candidatus Cloacimonas sp.]
MKKLERNGTYGNVESPAGIQKDIEKFSELFTLGEEFSLLSPKYEEIGWLVRQLSFISLPYKNPHTNEYIRRNGNLSISIMTPTDYGGVPYGKYPRLFRILLETEAKRTNSPDIVIGDSLGKFCELLGIEKGGKTGYLLEQRARAFFATTFNFIYHDPTLKGKLGMPTGYDYFKPVKRFIHFWDKKNPDQKALWDGYISLTPEYFDLITRHNKTMPIDLRIVRILKDFPLRLDIYTWLNGRFHTLKKPTLVSFEDIAAQFGSDYSRPRDMRKHFLKELKTVQTVCQDFKLDYDEKNLVLFPSQTSLKNIPNKKD